MNSDVARIAPTTFMVNGATAARLLTKGDRQE